MQKTVAIIPARYASTRFLGKPLALLGGKPVIKWVWENVSAMPELACAVVATDDERIAEAVKGFGGRAVMTASTHRSGTDRCGEVVRKLREEGQTFDVAINVQGDEPFVRQEQLRSLVDCFADGEVQIATLKTAIHSTAELMSPNNVKVACDLRGRALYFSRQPFPHVRGVEPEQWMEHHTYFKHVGIYAFRTETLEALVRLQQSPLELCESLEQLRWLENGYEIQVKETAVANIGIDTPADMALAEQYLTKERNN